MQQTRHKQTHGIKKTFCERDRIGLEWSKLTELRVSLITPASLLVNQLWIGTTGTVTVLFLFRATCPKTYGIIVYTAEHLPAVDQYSMYDIDNPNDPIGWANNARYIWRNLHDAIPNTQQM